jgi:flagellar biosynthesis/type III secretory pathway ATPase
VYVLLIDSVERHAVAQQQIAATLAAAGGKVTAPPSVAETIEQFDRALAAKPKHVDGNQAELMRALGVGSGR